MMPRPHPAHTQHKRQTPQSYMPAPPPQLTCSTHGSVSGDFDCTSIEEGDECQHARVKAPYDTPCTAAPMSCCAA